MYVRMQRERTEMHGDGMDVISAEGQALIFFLLNKGRGHLAKKKKQNTQKAAMSFK